MASQFDFEGETPQRVELIDLMEAAGKFTNEVFNPQNPDQAPVPAFFCSLGIRFGDAEFTSGNATGVTAAPNPPELDVLLDQFQPTVAKWLNQSSATVGVPAGADFSFPSIPYGTGLLSPQSYSLNAYYGAPVTVPNAFYADIAVRWWNPVAPASISNLQLKVLWNDFGVPQVYDTGLFNCNNIPAENTGNYLTIATVTADFFRNTYSCQGTLQNFQFTNLFP